MSLMNYFFNIPFHFQQYNFFGKTVLTFLWDINILLLVLYGSLESSSQLFEFKRCHFFEHDGMLRELFYCLWRGSNMSVVCTEDEIIFIYLECVLRKMAKNFVPCDKKFITLSLDIRTLFRYYRRINKSWKNKHS